VRRVSVCGRWRSGADKGEKQEPGTGTPTGKTSAFGGRLSPVISSLSGPRSCLDGWFSENFSFGRGAGCSMTAALSALRTCWDVESLGL
jgi:hypothetical protein